MRMSSGVEKLLPLDYLNINEIWGDSFGVGYQFVIEFSWNNSVEQSLVSNHCLVYSSIVRSSVIDILAPII